MRKVKPSILKVGIKICLTVCLVALSSIGWGDGHLKVMEKEKQLVLTGEISKALGEYDEHLRGAVEYLICGRDGKEYESIIIVDATAKEIYDALSKLGVEVGTPPGYDEEKDAPTSPTGTAFIMSVAWKDGDEMKKVRAEELILNVKTKKPLQQVAWIYSGSRIVPDLDSEDEDAMLPQAFMSNDIVALRVFDASALFQNPLPESSEENIYKKNDAVLPELGTPITLTIEVNQKMQLYVLISGKVQGVGFRNFTQLNAKQLGVNGYAKNLPNGKVEVVAEGDKAQLDALVTFLKKGPRYARVDSIDIDARAFTGEYETFGIRY
ncbi:MAG: acylphosphatase [Candidatus Poribacteria bacterium]|nr:acylphosphatase [Candidatus Poribacteria bacterium]